LAVKAQFDKPVYTKVPGDCARCAGLGFISAYRHIRGGRCLACDGTTNAPR
jgi:hypothetical protein